MIKIIILFINVTGGTTLFLLHFLGVLPTIQLHLRVPTRAPDAHKRTLLRNVPSLVLLHSKNHRRPTYGARPPYHIRNHNVLDGRIETISRHVPGDTGHRPTERARGAGVGASPRGHSNGRETSHHVVIGADAAILASQWLLHSTYASVHRLVQVHFV